MRATLLSVVFAMLAQAAWCEDLEQDGYREAFFENALASLTQVASSRPDLVELDTEQREAAISNMARIFTECHMQAMAAYSPGIQEAAYRVIATGGSYPQAKQALNLAIATEGAAGGDREAEVKAMFEKAGVIAQECIQRERDAL